MNQDGAENGTLKGFYSYKNTFDRNSVWVKVPKQVQFVINNDPYGEQNAELEDFDPGVQHTDTPPHTFSSPSWSASENAQRRAIEASHGLEALSAAASVDHYNYMPAVSDGHSLTARDPATHSSDALNAMSPLNPRTNNSFATSSPMSANNSNNNNLNFLLNPSSSAMSSAIDPNLERGDIRPNGKARAENAETDFDLAFLLRHFSEGPGMWMDLFDLRQYFAHHVPVKATTNPLLKYSAAAYAAKQLSRVRGKKPILGGLCSNQAPTEIYPNAHLVDWGYKAAACYDSAITLLMEALIEDERPHGEDIEMVAILREAFDEQNEHASQERGSLIQQIQSPVLSDSLFDQSTNSSSPRKRRETAHMRTNSDELAAATAILCVYEFLDASGSEWSRHLDGTKSLLDIAENSMMPLRSSSLTIPRSRARQATFWNFARQDLLSAIINETHTRLDSEDLLLWKDAGLLLDENGFVKPGNTSDSAEPDQEETMQEDMFSNALVWLLTKIINYGAAGDRAPPNRESWLGINQKTIHQRWFEIQEQLDMWYSGLPKTFRPSASILSGGATGIPKDTEENMVFPETWYCMPMCSSTMQSYHMAQMLMSINQPQHSTIGQTTFYQRLGSYKSTAADVEAHAKAICSIAVSRPNASVRIHSVQPLFFAGQCLEKSRERIEVIRLLREIEDDTGWATEYRVKQLLEYWGGLPVLHDETSPRQLGVPIA